MVGWKRRIKGLKSLRIVGQRHDMRQVHEWRIRIHDRIDLEGLKLRDDLKEEERKEEKGETV